MMGATTFVTQVTGKFKDAGAAFNEAHSRATWLNGHGGYTGTIAEKHGFLVVTIQGNQTEKKIREAISEGLDGRFEDKWGPAGCIEITSATLLKKAKSQEHLEGKKGVKSFIFFGWASC
jgi:hypothetical protein